MTTPADVAARLGAKLDALDLADDERALLHQILDAGEETEVSGFAVSTFSGRLERWGTSGPHPTLDPAGGPPSGAGDSSSW